MRRKQIEERRKQIEERRKQIEEYIAGQAYIIEQNKDPKYVRPLYEKYTLFPDFPCFDTLNTLRTYRAPASKTTLIT